MMGRSLEIESEIVIYLGMRHLLVLEGIAQGQDVRVNRYAKFDMPAGFQSGLVSQLGDATQTLQAALAQLFPSTQSELLNAWMVLGNQKLRQYSFQSSQYFQGESRGITSHEVRSVIQQTRSVATLPLSEFVLQTVPESFLVDDMPGVRNPLGLDARRLGVHLKIFTMNFQEFKNLAKVVDSSDLEITGYIPKSLAISEAVLSDEEKQRGVLILDLTSENTEIIFWKDSVLQSIKALDLAGKNIDQTLADKFNLDIFDAEKLKKQYGSFHDPANPDELIPLIERDGRRIRQIKRSEFHAVFVEAARSWFKKLLEEIRAFIQSQGSQYPHFVFTGGGAALDGLIEFIFKEYSIVARIGLTKHVEAPNELLVDPSMTHALGMFRWIMTSYQEQKQILQPNGFLQKTIASARDWFLAYF